MKDKPFSLSYDWKDFKYYKKLTPYQKHKIKKEYIAVVEGAIQSVINQSIKDRNERREELESHRNPDDHFRLDIGGEG
jgi:23S rRNA-/tRNA-specific pseudouridylate synthase